jgi:hypothetical protein
MNVQPTLTKTQVIDKCLGCKKITEDNFCEAYINPEGKWAVGGCGISTHISKLSEEVKKKINPLKASKRLKKKK